MLVFSTSFVNRFCVPNFWQNFSDSAERMINLDSAAQKKKIQPLNNFNVIGTPEDNFSAFMFMKKLKISGICLSLKGIQVRPPFGLLFTKSAKIRLQKIPASQIFIWPCGRTVCPLATPRRASPCVGPV